MTLSITHPPMTTRRIVALSAGAVTALVVFVAGMAFLYFGEVFEASHRLVFASIALSPVAMFAVMLGYAVWWLVLFLLTLALPGEDTLDGS
jgi:hypothetical protein